MTVDIEGTLDAMDLPTLIQFIAQDGEQILIHLDNDTYTGAIYLDNKDLCHAELHGPNGEDSLAGEEVIYELLSWQTGTFKVRKKVPPPTVSIHKNWDFLLMEGLRRVDERRRLEELETVEDAFEDESLIEILAHMSDEDAAKIKELVKQNKEINMANVKNTLKSIMDLDGAIATALVDWESGLTLGTLGSGLNVELAAAGNTNVVRSKLAVMKDLNLKGGLEDILITLTEQYHLIRILESNPHLFLYVALNRSQANLGMARLKLSSIEHDLDLDA